MKKDIGKHLLGWYNIYKRNLPWRKTNDPYLIWISEIILQQTRIDQGLDYYLRFVKRFPNINLLAQANEEEVLKYWQGLGYYSRARNLHFSARYIVDNYNGNFPNAYDEIKKLKGIGPYTAAAISSIAFNLPYPVIDGNVLRVVSRLFGITETINTSIGLKIIEKNLNSIFVKEKAADFNQAIMEFGALYCKPQNPECTDCIFKDDCIANTKKLVDILPNKEKLNKPKNLFLYYFVLKNENLFYVRKRENKGIWKNLYDFPCIERNKDIKIELLFQSKDFNKIIKNRTFNLIFESEVYKHQLSHKTIYARFFIFSLNKKEFKNFGNNFIKINEEELRKLPVSRLIENFIKNDFE
jgi:A/G-specific adenine glycosylase